MLVLVLLLVGSPEGCCFVHLSRQCFRLCRLIHFLAGQALLLPFNLPTLLFKSNSSSSLRTVGTNPDDSVPTERLKSCLGALPAEKHKSEIGWNSRSFEMT
eukprot:TRINITY_DN7091_c0_g2_i1.p1 TRINITY_DN7091_c0_g2~~TRINITY_DN7091_c0_g2_i1.p1  ORF type:complete len:101 (-),score=10.09 TRINITY_DN7091_c0_g2_i1:271-573(-)